MVLVPADVVAAFYDGIVRRDGAALVDLLGEAFAEDAAIVWPDSLPYGGRVSGSRALAKVFAGLASGRATLGPENLEVVAVIDGPEKVAVQLAFDWRAGEMSIPSGAVELWTFRDGLVREIRAFYADTAACVALAGTPTTSQA